MSDADCTPGREPRSVAAIVNALIFFLKKVALWWELFGQINLQNIRIHNNVRMTHTVIAQSLLTDDFALIVYFFKVVKLR